MNNDELVYIGSRSAFFFIGYPDEFINRVDGINQEIFNDLSRKHRNATNAIKNHEDTKPEEGQDKVVRNVNTFTKKVEEQVIPYSILISAWKKRKDHLEKNLSVLNKAVEKYVPIKDRKVKETYRRIPDAKKSQEIGTIVIVQGYEIGR